MVLLELFSGIGGFSKGLAPKIRAMSCEEYPFNILPDKNVRSETPNGFDCISDKVAFSPLQSLSVPDCAKILAGNYVLCLKSGEAYNGTPTPEQLKHVRMLTEVECELPVLG